MATWTSGICCRCGANDTALRRHRYQIRLELTWEDVNELRCADTEGCRERQLAIQKGSNERAIVSDAVAQG